MSVVIPLADLGIDHPYGLSGTATYACGTTGPTLTFTSFRLDF